MKNVPNQSRPLYIAYAGPSLLEMPLLNKGSAFTPQERIDFNLIGLLPQNVETIEEQVDRVYRQYEQCASDLDKHIYLRSIQDNNETLFFRLLESHLDKMLPIIYTPTVGQACQEFSKIYRTHRGLFISWPDRDRIDDIQGGYREIGVLRTALQSLLGKLGANEAALTQASRRKDEFLATLAHELRNPLAPIRTGLE
uniref:histidine kinase dimerization/phospho-acceptor domain-containing protein n=1 Tax=Pseudomonas sp. TaxID=306 RepID=UPI00338D7C94